MLLVGCPLSDRAWVISDYTRHVASAAVEAGLEPGKDFRFIFAGNPADETFNDVRCFPLTTIIDTGEPLRTDERDWYKPGRFDHMVDVRNALLAGVRELEPDLFLSLDSDIMCHPQHIKLMMAALSERGWDAVGGKTHMTYGTGLHPSYLVERNETTFDRTAAEGCFPVDIIMAMKLMTPPTYNIDYESHIQGEDIGWSKAVRRAGYKLGWEGTVTSKHILNRNFPNDESYGKTWP